MLIDATFIGLGSVRRVATEQVDRLKDRLSLLRAERRLRQAIVSLNDQDDFVLLDLGIRRDQIVEVVRHGRPAQDRSTPWWRQD